MGFADLVGIISTYVKIDFALSDTIANLLPATLFGWLFIFAIPVGLMMNKIGRKNTVLLSMVVTAIAFLIPIAYYCYASVLIAFALLGIGNTMIQVSLNPLLSNVVPINKLTSSLTAGQFIKAIASLCGPIFVVWSAVNWGCWQQVFFLFSAQRGAVLVILMCAIYLLFIRCNHLLQPSKMWL